MRAHMASGRGISPLCSTSTHRDTCHEQLGTNQLTTQSSQWVTQLTRWPQPLMPTLGAQMLYMWLSGIGTQVHVSFPALLTRKGGQRMPMLQGCNSPSYTRCKVNVWGDDGKPRPHCLLHTGVRQTMQRTRVNMLSINNLPVARQNISGNIFFAGNILNLEIKLS